MEAAANGMTTLIGAVDSVVTATVGWVGDYVGLITESGNEVLLLFTVLPIVGIGVGIIKRMISL